MPQNKNITLSYCLPFAVFMAFIALGQSLPGYDSWLYPLKTIVVGGLLIYFRKDYDLGKLTGLFTSLFIGLIVLLIWIGLEDFLPLLQETEAFNPLQKLPRNEAIVWIAIRLFGACIIVPVMEEIFWRGFLARWLINNDFTAVRHGQFTLLSFVATSLLFGLEHQRWFVGILAGVAYNLLYMKTRNLKTCIIAHAVTNLGLGIYVIYTNEWQFW
ncbi:MAG: CAAX prenyl protease-related protein [Lentisphaeraceae bacterium]|nr:CAAX prenyl protease-related protein [Lentisphaeraceae bacterium]